jgi:hypothetical protein
MTDEALLPNSLNSPFANELWHIDGKQFYLIPKGSILTKGSSKLETFEERRLLVDSDSINCFRCSLFRAISFMIPLGIWAIYFLLFAIFQTIRKGESNTTVSGDLLTRTATAQAPRPEPASLPTGDIQGQQDELDELQSLANSVLDEHTDPQSGPR